MFLRLRFFSAKKNEKKKGKTQSTTEDGSCFLLGPIHLQQLLFGRLRNKVIFKKQTMISQTEQPHGAFFFYLLCRCRPFLFKMSRLLPKASTCTTSHTQIKFSLRFFLVFRRPRKIKMVNLKEVKTIKTALSEYQNFNCTMACPFKSQQMSKKEGNLIAVFSQNPELCAETIFQI